MRVAIPLLIIAGFLASVPSVYGQTQGELDFRFVPSKLIEGTEGTMHVYTVDSIPQPIDGLVVTTSNPSIVAVADVKEDQGGIATLIKIKAVSEGSAEIALAAPGFLPKRIPVTIFPNEDLASEILMKITPDVFSTNGPKEGYVSVELVNEDKVPVFADEDIVVNLEVTKGDIVSLRNSSLVIKKGEYFSVGKFETKQSGKTNLVASSSFGSVSGEISVGSEASEKRIQSFVYPEVVNNFHSSFAYLVIQLQDSGGNPIIAKEDIPVSVRITDSEKEGPVNSSPQESIVRPVGQLVIKEGSYWAQIQLAIKAGLSGTFDVRVSAKGYLVPEAAQLETTLTHTRDDKSARIDILPVLATGKEELIGILHLEDINGEPVISNNDLTIVVDSSDPKTLSVKNVNMKRGDSVALVFGNAEKTENDVTLTVVTEDPQTLNPIISLPEDDEFSFVAEPLVTKVLEGTAFPIAIYLSDSDGSPVYSTVDASFVATPRESIEIEQKGIKKGDPIMLVSSKIFEDASTTITFMAGEFSATSQIESFGNGPSVVSLNHPEKILSNSNSTFAVELLNEQKSPIFAKKDFEIKLVSANPSIVETPYSVTISEGSYYSVFDMGSKIAGQAKLSVLTDGMPLSEFNLLVTSLKPQVSLSAIDVADPSSVFDAVLLAKYEDESISGLKIEWSVQGAGIQSVESVTDQDGKASISLLSPESGTIDLKATISGGSFEETVVTKQIAIKVIEVVQEQSIEQVESFNIMGLDPIYFVIPAGAAGGVFFLKRRGMLEGVGERFNFIEGLKEKILQIRGG